MLLKFTTSDMLNTALIDVTTGERAYNIVTVLSPSKIAKPSSLPEALKMQSPANAVASTSKHVEANPVVVQRRTTITDATGKIIADMEWNGRHPDITIVDEKVGALTDLFGTSVVRFLPKTLSIPTRFDTEYIWIATPDTLTLYDYDTDSTKGTFHQNVIRIPTSLKSSAKLNLPSSPSKNRLSSYTSSSSSSSSSEDLHSPSKDTAKATFIQTHVPGLGSNYLEFNSHPLCHDVEIIISFLMMEMLRRGRFILTPYTFEKPKLWQLREAKDLVMRRIRRNTV
ncbi:hypothetical protein BDQ12DRAFT_731993 [Crucibulum laeve]|uniref:Uncharacterized protein n=1 Tax=Crucibulum laeve TaxID=68775 RepID=A0A5C3MAK2_9AGAR|nr:hypothetical protein BDQ12DRAFT_731993 [Crucibulum laeve]